MMIKKQIFSLCMLISLSVFSHNIQAQITLGGGPVYSTKFVDLGIIARATFGLLDIGPGTIVTSPNVSFYPFRPNVKWVAGNIDVQYHLGEKGHVVGYPIIGLRYELLFINDFRGNETGWDLGYNLGAGTQYSINNSLNIFLEGKYLIGIYQRFVLGLGVTKNIG